MSKSNKREDQAIKDSQTARSNFNDTVKATTGEQGYNKSLGMASKGANALAGGAQQQAQNAYRSAGMSKAQAAQLAGNQANQAYQQGFGQQQQQGANMLTNQLQGAGQSLNAQMGIMGAEQNAAQNQHGRMWNNIGKPIGMVSTLLKSDKDLKVKAKIEHTSDFDNFCSKLDNLKKGKSKYRDLFIQY